MTTIDIQFCSDLIRSIGIKLVQECKKDKRLPTFEAVIADLDQMNEWTAQQLQQPIAEKYPDIPWSDSEFNIENQGKSEYAGEYWVFDPLDGALHFAQGFSFFALSLCLIRDGKPVVSFVYDPSSEELFHAVAGDGAYMNGKLIQVATKPKLDYAYLTTSLPSNPAKDADTANQTLRGIAKVMPKVFAVKMLGAVSLQLAYVASGRLDGYFEFGDDYYDWLAGALLVQEAGGTVTDEEGGLFTWGTKGIVAANGALHVELLAELKS